MYWFYMTNRKFFMISFGRPTNDQRWSGSAALVAALATSARFPIRTTSAGGAGLIQSWSFTTFRCGLSFYCCYESLFECKSLIKNLFIKNELWYEGVPRGIGGSIGLVIQGSAVRAPVPATCVTYQTHEVAITMPTFNLPLWRLRDRLLIDIPIGNAKNAKTWQINKL